MNARQLSRELRRIARQEVPNGEPDLWPEIRRRVAPRRTPYSTPGMAGHSVHSDSAAGSTDVSSVYVWSTDQRRGRFWTGTRVLAASAALVLVVAVLAVVMSNRGNGGSNKQPVGAISTPTGTSVPTVAATAGIFGKTGLQPDEWPSDGKLTVPIRPAAGSSISGSINLQILPTGDIRFSFGLGNPQDITTWHVVPETCDALATTNEQELDGQDIVPALLLTGGSIELIPSEKTHQPLTMVAYAQRGGLPVACASAPEVPPHFVVSYDPAPSVPRTCPVTLPTKPLFAPSGASNLPTSAIYGGFWYGTNDLYTGLPLDGIWAGAMKVFWWSSSYAWMTEPIPALTVTGKRLDGNSQPATVDSPTNGAGGMLVGVTFPTTGCWRISGTYRQHTLSFVVWVNDLSSVQFSQTPGPVPTTTPSPGADGLTHTDQACHATQFAPSTANPSDLNLELRGTVTSGQFWALLFQQMPIYARQKVQIAWKIGSAEPLTLTIEDAHGDRIDPTSGPDPNTAMNWPRPGSEWLTSIDFPYSGCWHIQAHAGAVTGDMWLEVFARPGVPPATATPAATPTPIAVMPRQRRSSSGES